MKLTAAILMSLFMLPFSARAINVGSGKPLPGPVAKAGEIQNINCRGRCGGYYQHYWQPPAVIVRPVIPYVPPPVYYVPPPVYYTPPPRVFYYRQCYNAYTGYYYQCGFWGPASYESEQQGPTVSCGANKSPMVCPVGFTAFPADENTEKASVQCEKQTADGSVLYSRVMCEI